MHLDERSLLVRLFGKPNRTESVRSEWTETSALT